jgi:DNA-binding PadR family transcriptional regulator
MYAQATYKASACGPRCGHDYRHDLRALLQMVMGSGEGEESRYGSRRHRGYGRGGHRGDFGGYGPFGWPSPRPGGPFGRGRKARRGDIRTAALLLLAEEPRNGYQIMQEVEQRSEGVWRPSPGSVYPALQQLEDEGLIRSEETEGRKLFHLTDSGRAKVQQREEGAPAPWEAMSNDYGESAHDLGHAAKALMVAFVQVMKTGDEKQLEQARIVLRNARRDLYRILADSEDEEDEPQGFESKDDETSEGES